MVSAIACIDEKWGIGKDGHLLVKIPEDTGQFKRLTMRSICIMGANTWISMGEKPLRNRYNLIVSKKLRGQVNEDMTSVISLRRAEIIIQKYGVLGNIFIIGGGQIYEQLLKYCARAYITCVYADLHADTFFPNLDEDKGWRKDVASKVKNHKGLLYQFFIYRRNLLE